MAPYPITPPADQPNQPQQGVRDMLDPSHVMPKSHEHALDRFDHDADERQADAARKASDAAKAIPLNFSLPPSRSLRAGRPRSRRRGCPSPPLSGLALPDSATILDEGLSQFPPPPAPPPRKLPPAPLQLRDPRPSPPSRPTRTCSSPIPTTTICWR